MSALGKTGCNPFWITAQRSCDEQLAPKKYTFLIFLVSISEKSSDRVDTIVALSINKGFNPMVFSLISVFFGEAIAEPAASNSFNEAEKADCFILIGTTGTVAPANMIPARAKANGAKIIEINPYKSEYTGSVTDIFLEDRAVAAMERLMEEIDNLKF
jgi:NAD-dependent SIR2 family protein deacetylase